MRLLKLVIELEKKIESIGHELEMYHRCEGRFDESRIEMSVREMCNSQLKVLNDELSSMVVQKRVRK